MKESFFLRKNLRQFRKLRVQPQETVVVAQQRRLKTLKTCKKQLSHSFLKHFGKQNKTKVSRATKQNEQIASNRSDDFDLERADIGQLYERSIHELQERLQLNLLQQAHIIKQQQQEQELQKSDYQLLEDWDTSDINNKFDVAQYDRTQQGEQCALSKTTTPTTPTAAGTTEAASLAAHDEVDIKPHIKKEILESTDGNFFEQNSDERDYNCSKNEINFNNSPHPVNISNPQLCGYPQNYLNPNFNINEFQQLCAKTTAFSTEQIENLQNLAKFHQYQQQPNHQQYFQNYLHKSHKTSLRNKNLPTMQLQHHLSIQQQELIQQLQLVQRQYLIHQGFVKPLQFDFPAQIHRVLSPTIDQQYSNNVLGLEQDVHGSHINDEYSLQQEQQHSISNAHNNNNVNRNYNLEENETKPPPHQQQTKLEQKDDTNGSIENSNCGGKNNNSRNSALKRNQQLSDEDETMSPTMVTQETSSDHHQQQQSEQQLPQSTSIDDDVDDNRTLEMDNNYGTWSAHGSSSKNNTDRIVDDATLTATTFLNLQQKTLDNTRISRSVKTKSPAVGKSSIGSSSQQEQYQTDPSAYYHHTAHTHTHTHTPHLHPHESHIPHPASSPSTARTPPTPLPPTIQTSKTSLHSRVHSQHHPAALAAAAAAAAVTSGCISNVSAGPTNFGTLLDVIGGSINTGTNSAGLSMRTVDDYNSKKYYHPLYAHGVCRWPGCELALDDVGTFVK